MLLLATTGAQAGDASSSSGAIAVPEPTVLARGRVEEKGESPRFYRLDPPGGWLAARVGLGPAVRVYGRSANTAAFAFDAMIGARLALHRSQGPAWALLPDLGYANVALGADSSSHLLMAGVGLGKMHRAAAFGVVPRFVYGSEGGQRALGVRTGLLADGVLFGEPGIIVELSHAVLWLTEGASHDVRFIVGIDPLMFLTRTNCRARFYGPWSAGCK